MNYNSSMTLNENIIYNTSNFKQVTEQKKQRTSTTTRPSYLTVEPSTFEWKPSVYGPADVHGKSKVSNSNQETKINNPEQRVQRAYKLMIDGAKDLGTEPSDIKKGIDLIYTSDEFYRLNTLFLNKKTGYSSFGEMCRGEFESGIFGDNTDDVNYIYNKLTKLGVKVEKDGIDLYITEPKKITSPLQSSITSSKSTTDNINQLKVVGPFDSSGIEWPEKTIIVQKKQLMAGVTGTGVGDGYFILTNTTNKPINIKNIISPYLEERLKIAYTKKPLGSKKSMRLYVTVYDSTTEQERIDRVKKFESATMEEKAKLRLNLLNSMDFNLNSISGKDLVIQTDFFEKKIKLNFGYSQAQTENDKVTELSKKRISPKGYKVPEYFSVFEYDDFINQVENSTSKCCNKNVTNSDYVKFRQNLRKIKDGLEPISPDEWGAAKNRAIYAKDNTFVNCFDGYKSLYEKYRDESFPNGIHSEDKDIFHKENDELKKQIEYYSQGGSMQPMLSYKQSVNRKKVDELRKKQKELYEEYGYDCRTSFDRFMDGTYGHLSQFGAFAILIVAGFVTEGATWITAANLLLNLSLGGYYLTRGNTREALTWFVFAFIDKLHPIYNVLANKVGRKLVGETLDTVCKDIAKIFSEGVTITSQAELKALMYTKMTRNQRIVFRQYLEEAKNSPNLIQDALGQFGKEVGQAKGIYKGLDMTSAMKLRPAGFKFIRNSAIDLLITIPLVDGLYDSLKSTLKNKGIDITWGEKDGKILERIKEGMTDSEIKRMFKSIEIILNGLTVPEQNYYVNNTLNVETSEKITELNSEISDANKVIKETKEKFKQAAASSDNDKEFFKVGGKYYEKEHDDWEKNLTPLTKLSIENPTTKKIRRFFNDTKSLEILNSKNYDENDVFTYYGNDKKIWDILNGENFEDYSETPENIDRKLKTKP